MRLFYYADWNNNGFMDTATYDKSNTREIGTSTSYKWLERIPSCGMDDREILVVRECV